MKSIDTNALIEEIEKEIEEGEFVRELPRFQKRKPTLMQIKPGEYNDSVIDADMLSESKSVTLIYGLPNTAKGMILKVFRKIVAPIMHPAVFQQNQYNENVAYTFELLDGEIQELKKTIANQQKEIEELKKKL